MESEMDVRYVRRGDVTDTYINGRRIPSWVTVTVTIGLILGISAVLAHFGAPPHA